MAIDKFKNNKAPGCDCIPAEMIKKGGNQLKKQYYIYIYIYNSLLNKQRRLPGNPGDQDGPEYKTILK